MARQATRSETCAGGVVYRRVGDRIELALGCQRDRLTGSANVRLAKGHVERGESLEQAARREVLEEIGVSAEVVAELGSVEYTFDERGVRVEKVVHFFLMEAVSQGSRPLDGEMHGVVWCGTDEARERLTFETERRVVARARRAFAKRTAG